MFPAFPFSPATATVATEWKNSNGTTEPHNGTTERQNGTAKRQQQNSNGKGEARHYAECRHCRWNYLHSVNLLLLIIYKSVDESIRSVFAHITSISIPQNGRNIFNVGAMWTFERTIDFDKFSRQTSRFRFWFWFFWLLKYGPCTGLTEKVLTVAFSPVHTCDCGRFRWL